MTTKEDSLKLIESMLIDHIGVYGKRDLLKLLLKYTTTDEQRKKYIRYTSSNQETIIKWMSEGATFEEASNLMDDTNLELLNEAREMREEGGENEED